MHFHVSYKEEHKAYKIMPVKTEKDGLEYWLDQRPKVDVGGGCCCFVLVSCMDYFLTLMLETVCSPEVYVAFHGTSGPYIPEDTSLHTHH